MPWYPLPILWTIRVAQLNPILYWLFLYFIPFCWLSDWCQADCGIYWSNQWGNIIHSWLTAFEIGDGWSQNPPEHPCRNWNSLWISWLGVFEMAPITNWPGRLCHLRVSTSLCSLYSSVPRPPPTKYRIAQFGPSRSPQQNHGALKNCSQTDYIIASPGFLQNHYLFQEGMLQRSLCQNQFDVKWVELGANLRFRRLLQPKPRSCCSSYRVVSTADEDSLSLPPYSSCC